MVTLFLCDDSPRTIKSYVKIIDEIARKNSIPIIISTFLSGEELAFHLLEAADPPDIIYLDIILGTDKMNGIETAKLLRERGCTSEIVFLTSVNDYVYDAFDVAPVQYLLKHDTSLEKFERVFLRTVELVEQNQAEMFVCESNHVRKLVPIKEISYFEIQKRILSVHYGQNKKYEFYGTMDQLEQQLSDKNFVRAHRSYLVNLQYIVKFKPQSILLKTDVTIPVGVTYMKPLKETFSNYLSSSNIIWD